MPFEALISVLVFAVGLFWSLRRLIKSTDREFSYVSIFFLLFFLVFLPIRFINGVIFYSKVEENAFSTKQDVLGLWVYDGSTLLFQNDNKVIIKLTPSHKSRYNLENKAGYWQKNTDFNLYIFNEKRDMEGYLIAQDTPRLPPLYQRPKYKGTTFRIIKYDGKYRIIKEYGDPDSWDKKLEFIKMPLTLKKTR